MTKKQNEELSKDDLLTQKLASLGLTNAIKLADEYEDLDVICFKSGFPNLDEALHPTLKGIPRSRHVEIFSKKESSGKTSLALAIAVAAQKTGMSVCIIDIEKTITREYLLAHGAILESSEDGKITALRIMRSTIDYDSSDTFDLYLENVLDTIKATSRLFDLIIVDSVDALVRESEAAKSAEDNKQTGGISKKLSEWFRENTNVLATIIWINQTRQSLGYSPTGSPTYVTSGGRAIPFYSTIRMELSMIEKLVEDGKDPHGFVCRINIVKNKIAPPYRQVDLHYLYGKGFSTNYALFTASLKKGIIVKKTGWYSCIKEDGTVVFKCQGEKKTFDLIDADPNILAYLRETLGN